jgi:hypothetical protein
MQTIYDEQASGGDSTPAPIDSPPWGWRDVGLVAALTLGGAIVLMLILSTLFGADPEATDPGLASPTSYLATASIYGIMLLGIYGTAARRAGWQMLGMRTPSWRAMFVTMPLLLVLALAGMIMINLAIMWLRGEPFDNPQVEALTGGNPLSTGQLLVLAVLVAGIVPLAEELFFRGMIYPLLRHRWGTVVAIVVSAALFAVVHLNLAGEGVEIVLLMPALFFMGLVLGQLREWSRSVVPCIALHAIWNGIALLSINAVLSQPT